MTHNHNLAPSKWSIQNVVFGKVQWTMSQMVHRTIAEMDGPHLHLTGGPFGRLIFVNLDGLNQTSIPLYNCTPHCTQPQCSASRMICRNVCGTINFPPRPQSTCSEDNIRNATGQHNWFQWLTFLSVSSSVVKLILPSLTKKSLFSCTSVCHLFFKSGPILYQT